MEPLNILLIEDSPSDVRLIREALKENSMSVEMTVAQDGVEAMNHLAKAERGAISVPDLVLLDLNLPRKNGREVLAEIKNSPALRRIPVVVLTSSRSEDDIQQAYDLNANCYITKPSDLADYMNVVRAIEHFWFMTATLPDAHAPLPMRSARLRN
jgi:two-component system, chemotaxis family, response regulator Rcp1